METYIIRASNGNQGAVTNRLQNEVASGKSVQETRLHSPVFHDMLEFPQSEDAPIVDGCPVVLLLDAENDPRCFLKALFDYR
jgi:hypothetical protein